MKRQSKNVKPLRDFYTPVIRRVLRNENEPTPDKRYPSEYATKAIVMRTKKSATLRQARFAADEAFSYSCRCEHDCCGHWQRRVYYTHVFRIKRGEFAVVLHYARNV